MQSRFGGGQRTIASEKTMSVIRGGVVAVIICTIYIRRADSMPHFCILRCKYSRHGLLLETGIYRVSVHEYYIRLLYGYFLRNFAIGNRTRQWGMDFERDIECWVTFQIGIGDLVKQTCDSSREPMVSWERADVLDAFRDFFDMFLRAEEDIKSVYISQSYNLYTFPIQLRAETWLTAGYRELRKPCHSFTA